MFKLQREFFVVENRSQWQMLGKMVTLSHGRNFFKRPKRTSKFEHYEIMVGKTLYKLIETKLWNATLGISDELIFCVSILDDISKNRILAWYDKQLHNR